MPFIKDISVRARKIVETFFNLYSWGANFSGGVGDGTSTTRSSPVFITSNVSVVANGAGYMHFIKNGQLYSVGSNAYGQLGLGNTISRSSPVQVGSQTYWIDAYATKVYGAHSLFLSDESGQTKLWAVGFNGLGALGLGDTTDRSSPVQIGTQTDWITAACGGNHSLAIRLASNSTGTLWSWGYNASGQLGLGDTTDRSSPVQVGQFLIGFSNCIRVAAGEDHTLVLADSGNALYSWGANGLGQLGLGNTISYSAPQLIASDGYFDISAGYLFSAAIKSDGTLWMWGSNGAGQLGQGNTTNRSSPVQVGTGNNWNRVRCGDSFTVAIKTDGTLWAWGQNNFGQLGLGDTTNRSSPVQVGSITNWMIAQEIFTPNFLDAGIYEASAIRDPL